MVTMLEKVTGLVSQVQQEVGMNYAVPGSDELVLYCRTCLWYQHSPVNYIAKAIITTPKGKDGRFDGDLVPSGASVWITVTDPSSPLHGRPILITKRPDNLFALTGGGGVGGDARRHMILTGKPRRTKRDMELEDEINEARQYNEPLLATRRKLTEQSRKDLREAADGMLAAMGLEDFSSKQIVEQKDDVQRYVNQVLGDDESNGAEAKRLTDTIMRQVVASERTVRERVQRDRQLKVLKAKAILAREGEKLGREDVGDVGESALGEEVESELDGLQAEASPMPMSIPNIESLMDMSSQEQEHQIVQHFEKQVESYFDPDRDELDVFEVEGADFEEGEIAEPTMMLGESVGSIDLKSPEKLEAAIEHVNDYWNKRKEAEDLTLQLKKVPLAKVTPSTIAAIQEKDLEPVSLAEIEERLDEELNRAMRDNTALALYDALGDHWNDDTSLSDTLKGRGRRDTTMQFHINAGASSALAALGKTVLGTRFDTSRLIQDGNIEMAAASLALEVARKHNPNGEEYAEIVNQVRNHNSVNQPLAEAKTLERHSKLVQQFQVIQDQKENAELLDKVQISNLEADNLIAQRTNLGTALGSLQSSATFFDHLEKLKGAKRAPVISVSVGSQSELAESIREKLNLKNNYDIDVSDPSNVTLNIGLSSLRRYMREAPDVTATTEKYDQLKNNMEGVSEDAGGNLVVDSYDVPGWKNEFQDAGGNTHEYKWRVEQRNDMEWLKAATEKSSSNPRGMGGGLITRVTGAGKTNTALGFFGNKISENSDYKGLVVVPKGRAAQWHEEAERFSTTPTVLIPDGTKKQDVDEILANSKPGTIYVMGHREASRSHETIGLLQSDSDFADQKFGGLVIDEPQELQSRGQSGNIGALGKRLMKLNFDHRVGLTATPARRNPTEAYDLIKWTQGTSKQLGSKTGFVRTFSGFGGGTNAQDTSINKLFFDTIKPYISGDRITTPNFKVTRDEIPVQRTEGQRAEQSRIEAESADRIAARRQEIMQEARTNPKSVMRTGANWENTLSRRATQKAREEVVADHSRNMNGGDFNQNGKFVTVCERD